MPRTRPRRTVEEIAASVRSMRVTSESWHRNVRAAAKRRKDARDAEARRRRECLAALSRIYAAEALLRSQPDADVWLAMLERERWKARGETR